MATPVTTATEDEAQKRKREQREKFEKQAKDALLGAAAVVSLGMLIRELTK